VRIDRLEEDLYVFVSGLYAQATATVLLTPAGAIVVDTLPHPQETRALAAFVEERLGADRVRYVVNTHYHADHTLGNYLFPGAQIIAHDLCRPLLAREGRRRLLRARQDNAALAEATLRLPDITFQRQMHLHLGDRQLRLFHAPGHTRDGIAVLVAGVKVLVCGDALMPVPTIVDDSLDALRSTLRALKAVRPDMCVQGHGDVLLRGEVGETIDAQLAYLDAIAARVAEVVNAGGSAADLAGTDIETCGLSRIPLDGLVSRLHQENLQALYRQMRGREEQAAPS